MEYMYICVCKFMCIEESSQAWDLEPATLAGVTQRGNSVELYEWHRLLVSNGVFNWKKFVPYLDVVLLLVFKNSTIYSLRMSYLEIFRFVGADAHMVIKWKA